LPTKTFVIIPFTGHFLGILDVAATVRQLDGAILLDVRGIAARAIGDEAVCHGRRTGQRPTDKPGRVAGQGCE